MKTYAERIEAIEAMIAILQGDMDAVLKDNGAVIREDLTDKEAICQWDTLFADSRQLNGFVQRINSVLHSAEQYMFANCS